MIGSVLPRLIHIKKSDHAMSKLCDSQRSARYACSPSATALSTLRSGTMMLRRPAVKIMSFDFEVADFSAHGFHCQPKCVRNLVARQWKIEAESDRWAVRIVLGLRETQRRSKTASSPLSRAPSFDLEGTSTRAMRRAHRARAEAAPARELDALASGPQMRSSKSSTARDLWSPPQRGKASRYRGARQSRREIAGLRSAGVRPAAPSPALRRQRR